MKIAGYLGIDCGGTGCRVAWQAPGRRVDFIGGGGNFTTNPDACANAIISACQGVADKAGVQLSLIFSAKAYLGVAGVQSEADAADLNERLPLRDALIEEDRRAMVTGALGVSDGFVAGLGTGSFFIRRSGETMTSIGGWGFVLSDEASGAWLGRSLLAAALHSHDGLIGKSPLTEAVLDEFGGPSAIIAFARDSEPKEFARLAKGLAGAASAGDINGRQIMTKGADWIASAFRALGWREGARICLPGDLGIAYQPYLPELMRRDLVEPLGTPLEGALRLAVARG